MPVLIPYVGASGIALAAALLCGSACAVARAALHSDPGVFLCAPLLLLLAGNLAFRRFSIILLFHALVRRPGVSRLFVPRAFQFRHAADNLAVVAITFFVSAWPGRAVWRTFVRTTCCCCSWSA